MNPFALPGPKFLAFYALFACAVLLALYVARRHKESGPLPNLELKDPYLFACLNGGAAQVVRIAVLGLIDRGVLQVSGDTLKHSPGVRITASWSGIERQVLEFFTRPSSIEAALNDRRLLDFVRTNYERRLRSDRLVPDDTVRRARYTLLFAAILALGAVGGAKVWIALAAGRQNVAFLIILMAAAAVAAVNIANPYRTSLGDAYLGSLRSLFSHLRDRAATIRPGGGSRDLLWLTALFGAGVLPAAAFPFVRDLFPKPASDSGGGSCGSSGGCGGGGGGCGGCGS
jgi:uncharacterized protein (TIGR04222 family)